jgi:hypothetical protein
MIATVEFAPHPHQKRATADQAKEQLFRAQKKFSAKNRTNYGANFLQVLE